MRERRVRVATAGALAAGPRDVPDVPPRLPRNAGVNTFPTSFAQERLWVLEQIAPGRAAANVAGAFRVSGGLHRAILRRSLALVAMRYESLRTTFAAVSGVPLQIVSPFAAVSMPVVDLRRRPSLAADRSAVAADLAREMDRPFDVSHGPLLRFTTFRVADDAEVCCVALHHLIADAWSMPVFVREVAAVYRALVLGRVPELPDVRFQYADYAAWQRARFRDGGDARRLTTYWRDALDGAPYVAIGRGNRFARQPTAVTRSVATGVAAAARRLGRHERVSLFVTALTCWVIVLARWTGRRDVTVLSPFANRDGTLIADAIGFFVNLVALRIRVPGDPSFLDLLHRVRDVVRDAQRHQALPFERVLAVLGVERTLDRLPLSSVGFALEHAELPSIALPDADIAAIDVARATSRGDLALVLRDGAREMTARLEYAAGAVGAETAQGLLGAFVAVLGRAGEDPQRRVSELPATLAADAVTRVADRASPRAPFAASSTPAVATAWDRFAARVAVAPHAPAVRDGTTTVSYGGLAARADAVARALVRRGVEPGTLVGVWGERGMSLIAAMLGIFRAAAVYVPLDPLWPAPRLSRALLASGVRLVLTGTPPAEALLETERRMEAPDAWTNLYVAAVEPLADDTVVQLPSAPAPRDLAYVLYTSGSTGTPKGAMIEHAGLLNHLEAKRALLGLGADDRVAQTASAGFDISVWQCLAPLLAGASVTIVGDGAARDPDRLLATVARERVTVLEVVPAMLRALLDADDDHAGADPFASLRWLVVTGDQLAPALCRAWLERHPQTPLVNAYGPTECADDVTHHVITTAPEPAAVRVPIGRPIANTDVHVLDERLRPVADGEVGELCVTGVAVGRGYWRDPERTAAAFVPDLFTDEPDARLYRTGDLGRRLPDGTFECLGRRDRQVKIRGMRIELEEIEAVLEEHPDVREAAVVTRADAHGDPRLVAYVAPSAPMPMPATASLRGFIGERLPSAMVPSAFVGMPRLPRDANGKIDRRALATRARTTDDDRSTGRVPASAIERTLAEIWAAVLAIAPPSIDDNFFALGGDSLSSIQVAARACRHGLALRPEDVFVHQTIAELAAVATIGVAPRAEQDLVVGEVPLTPIQRLFLAADVTDVHHYNLSTLLETPADVDAALMAIAVEHLLRHHDVLRARFRRVDGEWRQHIAGLDGPVPFAVVDLSGVPEAELPAAIAHATDDMQASLDLEAGPIVRAAYLRLGAGRPGRLSLIVHHLACDVVSWAFLGADLVRVYEQLARGDDITLPPKTSSVRAWAERVADYACRPARRDELELWRRECGAGGVRLPVAGDRSPAVADVAHVPVVMGATETSAVVARTALADTSVESALLTALVTAVTDVSEGDGLLVYLEHHGRAPLFPELDVSRTAGWFTTVFPLCARAAPTRSASDTLERIARRMREIPDGGLGFGVLRSGMHDASAAAELASLPQPEISLNYLGRVDGRDDGGWRPASESAGCEVGVRGTRPTRVDVTAHVAQGQLHVDWAYDARSLDRALVEAWAARFLGVLGELANGRGASAADARRNARPR